VDWADLAAPAAAAAVLTAGVAVFLGVEHRRFGRLGGWQGQMVRLVAATGLLLAVLAAWPAPWELIEGCTPDASGSPRSGPLVPGAVALAAFSLLGFLAHHRYRRGVLVTTALGLLIAAAIELFRFVGAAGLPCAATEASASGLLIGSVGAAAGWLLSAGLSRYLPRGWPSARVDLMAPTASRRAQALVIDLVLWWAGTVLLAVALSGFLDSATARMAAPPAVALLLVGAGLLAPQRVLPGGEAMALSLVHGAEPAPRWRALLRSLLLYGPPVALFAVGWGMWAPLVLLAHVSTAVVRPDRAGLCDLLSGCRLVPRFVVDRRPPTRLMRLARTPRNEDEPLVP
jgi:hypothetical protein